MGYNTSFGASQLVLAVKNPAANAGDVRNAGSIPGSGRSPGGGKWQPTPVFLPGESHGQRSLEGYSPWGCIESETTEATEHSHTVRTPIVNLRPLPETLHHL